MARWRWWASGPPVLAALLFAVLSATAATDPTRAAQPGSGVPALKGVMAAASPQTAGVRPDGPPVVKRGGGWTAATGAVVAEWPPAYRLGPPTDRWAPWHASAGQRKDRRWAAYQGRAPPGTA